MISIYKNGNIILPSQEITENIYKGQQTKHTANIALIQNFPTDIFKSYGFDTALKLSPTKKADGVTQFMAYSYLLPMEQIGEPGDEYVFSCYGYCSSDCNANLEVKLEHSCSWTQRSSVGRDSVTLANTAKGEVVWMWGKFKLNDADGKVYIMFYPNQNSIDIFTSGYQLFAGISIYKGTTVYKPTNSDIIAGGICESPSEAKFFSEYIETNEIIET